MTRAPLLLVGNHFPCTNHNKNIWHEFAERLRLAGWQVITTSKQHSRLLRLIDMLWTIFHLRKTYRIAQVDVFSGKAFIWAELSSFLLKVLGKPFILILHGGALPEFSTKHPKRVKHLLGVANLVVTPSPYLIQALRHFRRDIHWIPNPLDLSAYPFSNRVNPSPRLVWVRSFHEIYNPSLAPKFLAFLLDEFPNIQLTMLGPDEGDGSLKRMLSLAEERQVIDHIKIIGAVPSHEVGKWLDQGDIFVNTSSYDTAPRSILEAMSNGLCVVSTNVGGIPWLIQDGINGFLVPPNDPEAMANAVRRILVEPGLSERLSNNARIGVEDFDWTIILPQWESLFMEIIFQSNE